MPTAQQAVVDHSGVSDVSSQAPEPHQASQPIPQDELLAQRSEIEALRGELAELRKRVEALESAV